MEQEKLKTAAANVAAIAVISLVLVLLAVCQRQWHQYSLGVEAEKRGDVVAAIAGYESAIHMYLPASPLVEKSAQRLWSLGEAFEQQGDRDRALVAYRSLRSSFYAVRGLSQPGKEWIERCDAKIALLARNPAPGGAQAAPPAPPQR